MTEASNTGEDFVFRTLELSVAEFSAARDFMTRSYADWLQGIHRVMLLAAGIGGVVVPLLANRSGGEPSLLRVGALWLFGSVVIGILMQFISRWVIAGLMFGMQTDQQKRYGALQELAVAATSSEIEAARRTLAAVRPRIASSLMALVATLIAECAFYGSFLWGAWLVVRGFTEKL